MQLSHNPTKLLISGRSGCGKSTYFTKYVDNSLYEYKFIFDHEGEYSYRKGLIPITTENEFLQWDDRQVTVYDPSNMFEGDLYAGFNFFLDWVFNICNNLKGKKLFACDELQKLIATGSLDSELTTLIETGRRRGIDWVAVTQQPNLIHNRLRNQITELVSFQQVDSRALKWFDEIGYNTEELKVLKRGEYILLDLEKDFSFTHGKINLKNSLTKTQDNEKLESSYKESDNINEVNDSEEV